ncbi:MAG: HAD family hydrolase [Wenzhouxiangellaceae bacterium]
MRKITTIIFDLDGTLVDTLPDIADAMNQVLSRHGLPTRPADSYRALIGRGIQSMISRLAPDCDSAMQSVLYSDFITRYNNHCCDRSTCYPDITQMLEQLRASGYTLAIFSNKRDDLTEKVVKHFFRTDTFKVVKGHTEGTPQKPHPVSTTGLLTSLNTIPARTILIGDTAVDVDTARALDMDCLGVNWGYQSADHLMAAGATTILDHPDQIFDWLEQYNTSSKVVTGHSA